MITEMQLKVYDRILATVSTAAIIIGGMWTLLGFINAQKAENELKKQQIRLTIFNDKKAIYYELSNSEAEIAACNSYDEVAVAQKHFRALYVGRAHIIAQLDYKVNNQKVNFRKWLDKYLQEKPNKRPFDYFADSSLVLANICQESLNIKEIYK